MRESMVSFGGMIGCTFVVLGEEGGEPLIRLAMLETVPTEGSTVSFHDGEDAAMYLVQQVHFTVGGSIELVDEDPNAVVKFPEAQIEAQITLVPDSVLAG